MEDVQRKGVNDKKMKIRSKFALGSTQYEFDIEEQEEMLTLHKAAILSNPPRYCDICQNNQLFALDSNKDQQGNIYVNVKCLAKGCGAKAKLGQYKSKGYFWHKFVRWQDQQQNQPKSTQPTDVRPIKQSLYGDPDPDVSY